MNCITTHKHIKHVANTEEGQKMYLSYILMGLMSRDHTSEPYIKDYF